METDQIQTLQEAEREAIVKALRATHGSKDGAAYLLMIGRTTLYRRIKVLEIMPEEYLDFSRRAA